MERESRRRGKRWKTEIYDRNRREYKKRESVCVWSNKIGMER